MASNASFGPMKIDEIASCTQQEELPKTPSPNPISCCPSYFTFTENHLPPHVQQFLYGQIDETFFSHFPTTAMHMLAWEWPLNLGYATTSCSMNKETNDITSSQGNNQGKVPSIFEYVNELGAFYKQHDPRHSEEVSQLQYQCQYPHHFLQMSQGSEVHNVHAHTMTSFKDEQSKLFGLHRSEVPPNLINKSQALYPNSIPMNYPPSASICQPRVAKVFVRNSSCDDFGMKAPNTHLLTKSPNVQSHQGDREDNCTRETQKAQTSPKQTPFNYSPLTYYTTKPTPRLFHTPNSDGSLNTQENYYLDECLQHHYSGVASNSLMSPMSSLTNVDSIDSICHGATQWNGLQSVAGIWGQVGAYHPRCLQQIPAPAPTHVISSPFPLSSTSSTLPNLFNSLQDSKSNTSFPSLSSPFQLSTQSAFSSMSSYNSHFSQPNHTSKTTDCQKSTFTTAIQHSPSFSQFQPTHSMSNVENLDNELKCHLSDIRMNTPTPSITGSRQELFESYQGSSSGMKSNLVENMTLANGTFQRPSFLKSCLYYSTKKI